VFLIFSIKTLIEITVQVGAS